MDRIVSEKEFHNAKFASADRRKGPGRYYLALEQWYRHYLEKVLNAKAANVLEIGSGIESIALQIDNAPFELQSIDIAEEAIRFTRLHCRLGNARFTVQDAHNMLFPDSSFDLVAGRGILHHLDIPDVCEEIKRVLRPGGTVIFGEPLDGNFLINLYRRHTPQLRTDNERPLSSNDFAVLRRHFGSVDVTYYGFLTLGPAVFGFRSPRIIHILDHFILNILKLGKFLAWACILSMAKEPK